MTSSDLSLREINLHMNGRKPRTREDLLEQTSPGVSNRNTLPQIAPLRPNKIKVNFIKELNKVHWFEAELYSIPERGQIFTYNGESLRVVDIKRDLSKIGPTITEIISVVVALKEPINVPAIKELTKENYWLPPRSAV
jgi:hypothetical protein